MAKGAWKIALAAGATVSTVLLVTWWIYFLLHAGDGDSYRRMVLWEGSALLLLVVGGGVALTWLTARDRNRYERLRFFFSTFSHDLKTSISRLRLQAEVLGENAEDPRLERLVADINRLDLQLENSLWLAGIEDLAVLAEEVRLSDLVGEMRGEFPELNIRIPRDVSLLTDRRLMLTLLRNIFHNSILHGKATEMLLEARPCGTERVRLEARDNGLGTSHAVSELGSEVLGGKSRFSNGIGLYLSRRILERMKGRIEFSSRSGEGFSAVLYLRGTAL